MTVIERIRIQNTGTELAILYTSMNEDFSWHTKWINDTHFALERYWSSL